MSTVVIIVQKIIIQHASSQLREFHSKILDCGISMYKPLFIARHCLMIQFRTGEWERSYKVHSSNSGIPLAIEVRTFPIILLYYGPHILKIVKVRTKNDRKSEVQVIYFSTMTGITHNQLSLIRSWNGYLCLYIRGDWADDRRSRWRQCTAHEDYLKCTILIHSLFIHSSIITLKWTSCTSSDLKYATSNRP